MFGLTTKEISNLTHSYSKIRNNIIGNDIVLNGPFGPRRLCHANSPFSRL